MKPANGHSSERFQGSAPAPLAETRPWYWSVRRELWENRSIYLAPLVVAALVLLGSVISVITLPGRLLALPADAPEKLLQLAVTPLRMAPAPIMLATFAVGVFYCLDAFYGERRDRSILFWKSLPVSDLTTALSKAAIPLLALPIIGFALSLATQVALLVVCALVLPGSPVHPLAVWSEFRFFQNLLIMAYGLTVHTLWFAPIYSWLLLVSAWARRVPVLWAVLPPAGLMAVEGIAFGTGHLVALLQYRLGGAMQEAFAFPPGSAADGDINRLTQLDPLRFLTRPGLWIGLVLAAVFLAAAVRLRRRREPN